MSAISKLLTLFNFTKVWTNPDHFPTYEGSESQVRADLQFQPNEAKNYINNYIVPKLNEVIEAVNDIVEFSVPDDSISSSKLKANSVVSGKVANDAVGTGAIQNEAVTIDKLDPVTVTANALGCAEQNHSHTSADVSGLAAALSSLTSHLADTVKHITSVERSTWNAKQNALTADTDYLTPGTASSTFLSQSAAASTYLTQTDAAATYEVILNENQKRHIYISASEPVGAQPGDIWLVMPEE